MKNTPLFLLALLLLPVSGFAQEDSFSDLPKDHYAYEAVTYLRSQGIISGYPDGTFKPDNKVNRAEALKIIVAPLITEEQLAQAKEENTVFSDVSNDDWYKPYVELARAAKVIDGPPEKDKFNGGNLVIKVEFMKMVQEAFGAKPKKYKCSVENLYRMILDDIDLKHYSKLVDIYNYISLKYMIPVGGDDIDHVDGNITLKFAEGNEKFIQLNSLEESNPKEGEVVYCDDNEVLCRRWNWRECDKSKMTENTKNATLVVEALEPVSIDELNTILDEMSDNINQYCGGESKQFILTKENIEIELGDN